MLETEQQPALPSDENDLKQKTSKQSEARYTILAKDVFGVASETIPTLEPGIYHGHYANHEWQLGKGEIVSDEIIITSETSQKIIQQIHDFWEMENAFKLNGLLHKRGFLLTGKAGCGKSSIITAVTTAAIASGTIVFIPKADECTSDFMACMQKIKAVEPNKKILVVMEDFEAFLRDTSVLARWLNILDGTLGFNNTVYLATSNYPENIDVRFTNRPSRFDTMYIIDAPSFEDRLAYIKNRKMDIDEQTIRDIANDTVGMSYAHIKELLISVYLFKQDYKNVTERMLNQSEHPISSQDFEEKRTKMGFDCSGEVEKKKDDLKLDEKKLEQIKKNMLIGTEESINKNGIKVRTERYRNGLEVQTEVGTPDDDFIKREIDRVIFEELTKEE